MSCIYYRKYPEQFSWEIIVKTNKIYLNIFVVLSPTTATSNLMIYWVKENLQKQNNSLLIQDVLLFILFIQLLKPCKFMETDF